MSGKTRRRAAAVTALALAAAAIPAVAFAQVQDPIPIGPSAYFIGLVNGKSNDAVITVACATAPAAGAIGHPVADQTLEVDTVLAITLSTGFTGSAAHSIDATLGPAATSSANPPVVFTSFFAPAAIPTTYAVPCSGTGEITFTPLPTSETAQSFTVSVTFVSISTAAS
jgi:hypothetical protein